MMYIVAVSVPSKFARNVTENVQLFPGFKGLPQWLMAWYVAEFAVPGVMLSPVMVTVDGPTLVTVTVKVDDPFRYNVPKLKFCGETFSPETLSVKFCCVAVIALVAVSTSGKLPPAFGIPERVAVPLWLSTKVTPGGKPPASAMPAMGKAAVVTVKEFDTP
jgi:hypothetical protein